jgi:hypothetical protein
MSITFTKLFSSITESTIWCEDAEVRVVWITMLAMCDKNGRVWGSIPGLANRARVSIEKAEEALLKFLSPDPYSRTKEHEGRRIEEIDGGWRLLNHEKYRAMRDEEERKAYKREWIANKRAEERETVDNVDHSRPQYTHTDTDTDTDTLKQNNNVDAKASTCPFSKIVDLYHQTLPELPKVAKLTKKRQGYIRQRWLEDLPSLDNWANFFDHVRQSKFLMGKAEGFNGRPPFRADLEWLTNPSNFAKIAENKYHVR